VDTPLMDGLDPLEWKKARQFDNFDI
jgi:hypothetical protein